MEREVVDGDRSLLLRVAPVEAEQAARSGAIVSLIDVTEHERAEKLRLTALDVSPVAMMMVNAAGVIVLGNSSAETMFGYAQREMLGQSAEILAPRRHRRAHRTHRDRFMTDPVAPRMGVGRELFARREDGSAFPVEIGLTPVEFEGEPPTSYQTWYEYPNRGLRHVEAQYRPYRGESGKVEGVVVTVRDITERDQPPAPSTEPSESD